LGPNPQLWVKTPTSWVTWPNNSFLVGFLLSEIDSELPKFQHNYEETFAPTEKWATIQTLFALATQDGWKSHQMDVKTTFLNRDIKENVSTSQP